MTTLPGTQVSLSQNGINVSLIGIGPQGASGAGFHNGTGTPASSIGIDGDYYLDTLTGIIYAKASGAWNLIYTPTSSGGILWTEVTTAAQALSAGIGYVMNNASQVVGTLPPTVNFGAEIKVSGKGAGGWKIAQNAGQTIHFDGQSTTAGAAGYIASQNTFDCVSLLCITANTDFLVTSSIGNITGV